MVRASLFGSLLLFMPQWKLNFAHYQRVYPWVLALPFLGLTLFLKILIEDRPSYLSRFQGLKSNQAIYIASSLKHYAFGMENLISALLWVQTLQESEPTPLPPNTVSWEYGMLEAITELDPKFEQAYEFGSIFLSALRRDVQGGTQLLAKWAKRRPAYWRPHYMLGSHLFLNIGDNSAAAPYLLKAAKMQKAPEWLNSLGIRLLSESGAIIQAYQESLNLWPALRSPEGKIRLGTRIRSLNFNLQKNLWKNALESYRQRNKKEPHFLSDLAPLYNKLGRSLASLGRENSATDFILSTLIAEKFEFQYEANTRQIIARHPKDEESLGKTGIHLRPQ